MSLEDDYDVSRVFGHITIFSFVSVVSLFGIMLFLASLNNYVFLKLEALVNNYSASGLITSTAIVNYSNAQTGGSVFLPYLDVFWLISFISLVVGSLVYSYNARRGSIFSFFNLAVFGIIGIAYVGGIVIQFTTWFKVQILYAVFPTLSTLTPMFAWYLSNIGVVNLVLVSLCVVVNFVELDFSKYYKDKDNGGNGEI